MVYPVNPVWFRFIFLLICWDDYNCMEILYLLWKEIRFSTHPLTIRLREHSGNCGAIGGSPLQMDNRQLLLLHQSRGMSWFCATCRIPDLEKPAQKQWDHISAEFFFPWTVSLEPQWRFHHSLHGTALLMKYQEPGPCAHASFHHFLLIVTVINFF